MRMNLLALCVKQPGALEGVKGMPELRYLDDVVTLAADPAAGWFFVAWSDDLQSAENPETITMDGNKAVTCTFSSHRVYFPLAGHSD